MYRPLNMRALTFKKMGHVIVTIPFSGMVSMLVWCTLLNLKTIALSFVPKITNRGNLGIVNVTRSRSSAMLPADTSHTTSCSPFTEMSLSCQFLYIGLASYLSKVEIFPTRPRASPLGVTTSEIKIVGIRKLMSIGYYAALFAWWYLVVLLQHRLVTNRQTDRAIASRYGTSIQSRDTF